MPSVGLGSGVISPVRMLMSLGWVLDPGEEPNGRASRAGYPVPVDDG